MAGLIEAIVESVFLPGCECSEGEAVFKTPVSVLHSNTSCWSNLQEDTKVYTLRTHVETRQAVDDDILARLEKSISPGPVVERWNLFSFHK
jgi:hypothetical protein